MKTWIAILVVAGVLINSANAQYSRIKEKARALPGQMTERHNAAADGAPPPGLPPKNAPGQPPPPATAAPPAPVAPVKPSAQQLAATKLKTDLAAAHAKGEATDEMKKQFAQDLSAAVSGSRRPSPAALAKFGDSLLPTVAAKEVTLTSDAKLVQNIVISLNCAGLSSTRLKEIADEVETVLTKSGVPPGAAGIVKQNLGAVAGEVQSGATK